MRLLVDLADAIAAVAAAGAAVLFFYSLPTLDSGPEFMQVGMLCLMAAIIPYCLAGALHRLYSRP